MTSPLDQVFDALTAALRGPVGERTLDLAAVAASDPVTGLRPVLDLFTIGDSFVLSTAGVRQNRASVVATGNASLAVKPGAAGAPAPLPTGVAALLTVSQPETELVYELELTVNADRWTFAATFPTLAETLRPAGADSGLVYGDSVLGQVVLTGVALTGRTAEKDLRITGALQPTGAVSPYQDWVSPWPLTLHGRLTMPADASAPPAVEARATTRGELPVEPATTLHAPGFGIRSVVGLDPKEADVSAFSELTVVGTIDIDVGKQEPLQAVITAPLLVSDRTWRLSVAFDPYLTLSRALAGIAKLFDVELDMIAVAPGLTALDAFGLSMVETVITRKSGGFSLDSMAITIESPPNTFWDAPIPFVKVGDLGTRWVLGFVMLDGRSEPVVGGSVYGSIRIGNEPDSPTIDLSAQLPAFVITGQLRAGTTIPVGRMFSHFFGHTGPPTPSSGGKPMEITQLSMLADPRQQRFAAAGEIEMSWPLPFLNDLRLTRLTLFITAAPSRLGGGIAGTLVLGAGDDPLGQPAMTLSAELPLDQAADEAGGWIFTGELLAGPPLTARHLVSLFVSSPPDWLGALAITALRVSVDTGRQTWSFDGAIELGFTVEILDTPVTIGAGAELELARTTALGRPTGTLTGWVSVNRLYLEVRRDIGKEDPIWAIKVQFGELWVQATTLWRGQGAAKHQAVTIQLGGVTLGDLLEYLVNLAAPTLGFRLEPPWDLLKRVDLARFALTIDPTEKSIDLTYVVQLDLGVMSVTKVGVHYELGATRKVDLILEGSFLGKPFTGADALRWDVIAGTPPTVPGQGESMLVVRYLGLGQRVRLKKLPDTVPAAIEALTRDMRPAKPGANPIKGSAMVYDAASQWLVGLDLSVLGTVDLALIFADPGLYGLSIGLRGEKAGPLAGLRFEVLYKKLAGGIGMFRIELRLPDQFRRIELGAVSITLGIVVVEIYTNGNFLVDLGFPHGRNFDRSFSLTYFPFIGRGGFYLGVLNGTTSRRVPQITNGTFSPVIELGLGIAVGVGKELAMGPLKGGAFVEVQVIFEGVLAWFNPSAEGAASAMYYRGQGIAAIYGKVYAEVDFFVVKASVTLEAYAQASVTFEAHRPTLFALEVSVRAEAKIKILFFTVSFSFHIKLNASITVGSVSPTPWTLAPVSGPGGMRALAAAGLPAVRRNHQRLLAIQLAAVDQLGFSWQPGLVLGEATKVPLNLLPAFSVADAPIDWTLPQPAPVADGTPDWRVAFLLFARAGDGGPAATVIRTLLRWSLNAVPGAGGEPGLLTAGQLQALSDRMQTRAVAEDAFSLDSLKALLQANVLFEISGDSAEEPEADAVAMPLPPFVRIALGEHSSDLSADRRIGSLYAHGASRYMADFSPVRDGAGPPPADDPAKYESFASYVFRDWCLMAAREAVRQAQLGLADHTITIGERSLDAAAADPALPRDEVNYVVRPGDTVLSVAAYLGAGQLELQALNPTLEADLAAAAPGASLRVLVGVAGATLVLDNAAEPMLADKTVELTGLRVPVRPGDTLTTIAQRLYGPDGDPLRLVADARLTDRRVLLAGATFPVPARSAPLPGVATPLLAGIFYVRYFADTQAPLTEWYAQSIAGVPANAGVLDTLQPGEDIPPGSVLLVPAAAHSDATIAYTTVPGDTLLRIGAALSLAQAPDAYPEPAWQAFRARVTGADVPELPALAIQPGETLQRLAARLALPVDPRTTTLVGWLAKARVLTPLEILEPSGVPFATRGLSLAGLASAAGLTLDELAARPEITGAEGLFPADAVLKVAHLPAQRVEALVASGASGAGLTAVIRYVSRQLLAGTRLPRPVPDTNVDDGRTVRAEGPLAGLAELTGQQLKAPPLDGSTAFAATVTKVDGADLGWLTFTGPKAPTALDFAATNSQLSHRYPSPRLPVAPESGPAPIAVAGEVVRTYGLGHRVELQGGTGLQIPTITVTAAGVPAAGGNPTLWRLPADALAKARAGSATPWTLARADDGTGVVDHQPIPDSTFATVVPVTVRRLPGPLDLGLYELVGADTADRELLLELAFGAGRTAADVPPMAVHLGVAPAPDAGDPSGVALLDATPDATFVVRANMATDVPLTAPPQTVVGTLGTPTSFLQLLWEASVAQGGGFHLGLAMRQGQGLPAGVFADDGTARLWVLAITGPQQQPAPAGRRLQPTDNCALVAPGLDASAQALYLEAADPASHPEELVKQAIIPAGSGGITLVLPPAPDPDGLTDPAAQAQARARQLFSLLLAQVTGAYADKDGRSAPPAPPQHDDGTNRAAWQRHRAEQARRLSRLAALAAGKPPAAVEELPSLWRYDQVIPLYQDGPPSVAPAVDGLPAPAGDPYRGFGGTDPAATATATFELGFADVLGNVTARPPATVEVTLGYTDPLVAPGTWPGVTTGWGLSSEAGGAVLTVTLSAQTGTFVPAPGADVRLAAETAGHQAAKHAEASYQLAQPTVAASILTTLRQDSSGAPLVQPVREGGWPLWRFTAAGSLFATACASATPAFAAGRAATIDELNTRTGLGFATLGIALAELPAASLLPPGTPLTATARLITVQGDTATAILARVPAGWPAPAGATALLTANAAMPLRQGVVLTTPTASLPPLPTPATEETLQKLADAHRSTPEQLALDNDDQPILREGFVFIASGVQVVVGAGIRSFGEVREAFAGLGVDVATTELARANHDVKGIFADAAVLRLKHLVAVGQATLLSLAGDRLGAVAALNIDTPDLFVPGTLVVLGDWAPAPVVPSGAEPLGQLAERLGCSLGQLLRDNAALQLADGGAKAPLPGVAEPLGPGVRVPYGIQRGDSLDIIAGRFATTAQALASANAQMPGLLAERSVTVTVAGGSASTQVRLGDTLDTILARLRQQQPAVTLEDLVRAVAPDPAALATGALLVCPAPTPAAPIPADAAAPLGVTAAALLQANAALLGVVRPGVDLVVIDPQSGARASTRTVAHDTVNAILGRLAEAGVPVDIAALLAQNPTAALLQAARVLLPPPSVRVSVALGAKGGPFATPTFPLTTVLRLQRARGAVHPELRTDRRDGPVERAESTIPAPAVPKPGTDTHTFDAFIDSCATVLPELRLASARVEGESADLWAADFGDSGIASVRITPGVTYPDGATQPRYFALRPLYSDLQSRTGLAVRRLTEDGTLGPVAEHEVQSIDVETWARRLLADLDLYLTGPYAAGMYRRNTGSQAALRALLRAKWRIADALAKGLAPVLASVASGSRPGYAVDPHGAAGLARAISDLAASGGVSLAATYDVATVLQYDTAVASAYAAPGTTLRPARLTGPAAPPADRATDFTLTSGTAMLGEQASFVSLALTVPAPARQTFVATGALDLGFDTLDFDLRPVDGADGYEACERLTFVRPLTGGYQPAAIVDDLGSPIVPVPLRAHPPLPIIVDQSATKTWQGEGEPSLQQAGQWTFGVSWAHEHAAQDEILLSVAFNVAEPNLGVFAPEPDLAAALGAYALIADEVRERMAGYVLPAAQQPAAADNLAASLAEIVGPIADAWAGHWSRSPATPAENGAAAGDRYGFRVSVVLQNGSPHLDHVSLALDGQDLPGPTGTWPELSWRLPDGSFATLAPNPDGPSGGALTYRPSEPIEPAGWPALRAEWPGLNVARTQNGHASVAVRRNEHLLGATGVLTNPAFVLSTAPVTATDLAVPLLEWSVDLQLDSGDLKARLAAAFGELFAGAQSAPVTLALGYAFALVPPQDGVPGSGIISEMPVALLPNVLLSDDPAGQLAAIAAAWPHETAADAFWSVSLSLASSLKGAQPRPLLTLARLLVPVQP